MFISRRIKLLNLILISAILLSTVIFIPAFRTKAAGESTGSDISGHWAEKQLKDWISKGFIKGYDDHTVRPNNTVARAEFITMMNRAFGFTEIENVNFSDLDSSGWEYDEVRKAVKAGYINGYEDGTIRPGNKVNRQEAAVMIAKLLKLDTQQEPVTENKFTDVQKIPEWSKHAIKMVAYKGIMGGYEDGTFLADSYITRAETVVTIDRALQTKTAVSGSSEQTTDLPTPSVPTSTTNIPNVATDYPLPAGYKIVWADNFSGSEVNTDNWKFNLNPRDKAIFTADSAFIGSDGLSIRSWSDNEKNYTAYLDTKGKHEFTYGLFNAKIRFLGGTGTHSAFWLQSATNGKYIGDPGKSGTEIDVVEFRKVNKSGKNISNFLPSTIHWDGYGANHKNVSKNTTTPKSMDGTWHNYSVLWTPTSYKFFFDNQQYAEIDDAVSQSPEYFILSCEIGAANNWAGLPPAGGYGPLATSNVGMDVAEVWVAQNQ
ncbi:S-layer homology domain-containing protein [Paenibacillus filicis]|uniref:S-layer homology domain-containing protein n=1 Tax=Paenibacillus gyeongsangnamensis TaxID=3388067 RepID=A0ABT4Q2C1_9BACL|nr:S-layer homology domain-containing protein [Paenibacillus filicis]MCZ8510962.1 S-layer homology domain-containing protein [Paenibacillus filicis]